jgi:hypothetical protein
MLFASSKICGQGGETMRFLLLVIGIIVSSSSGADARTARWLTSWTASVQGPYPVGNPSAQPDLRFALPNAAGGARDQTFRLMVMPSLWGSTARFRFSNALGTKPVTFDGLFVALQRSGSVTEPGSNRPITFAGKDSVTIAPGQMVWSDPVELSFVKRRSAETLIGRRLAVSFHVAGESGPMTWHAKAVTTSYLTAPEAGAKGASEGVSDFPFSTASWYFLDAIDMDAAAGSALVVHSAIPSRTAPRRQ